ncbi:hypothetical protein BH10PAT2_BH10PAT2_1980 [soil metagenome]
MPEKEIEPSHKIYKSRLALFIDNLIGGIGWGVGSVIGATVVVGLIGFFITQTKSVPFLGNMISIISNQIGSK